MWCFSFSLVYDPVYFVFHEYKLNLLLNYRKLDDICIEESSCVVHQLLKLLQVNLEFCVHFFN